MNWLKNSFTALKSRKDIRDLVVLIVMVELVFFIITFLINSLIDLEELQREISFLQSVQYQTIVFFTLSFFQVIILGAVIGQWAYRNRAGNMSIDRLIAEGENDLVEFKSSTRWDDKEGKVNKDLEYTIAKTLTGFLNSKGGTLLIGVADNKEVVGLERDYRTLKKQNADGFMLHMASLIDVYLGKEFSKFISIRIYRFLDKEICKVEVSPSNKAVYARRDNLEEFFIRLSASTQPMTTREAHEYINMHWKEK